MIKGLQLFQKYFSKVDWVRALIKYYSRKINCWYFRWATHSYIDICCCWEIYLELTKNVISKSLFDFNIFLGEVLKFFLYHQFFNFKITFLLTPLLYYFSADKQSGKKNLVWFINPNGFENILILLIKTVAI